MAKSRRLLPIHPGEILREDFMVPLGITMNKLALDLRVPVTRIAEIVRINVERIAVKATTSETLGFTGRREGIVAFANATIRLPWTD